jgi:N-acetylornithine carbamoyltransferase
MSGRDWLAMEEWSAADVDHLLTLAARVKRGEVLGGLERRVLAMVFLDPSLRTRASMETAMYLHGGHALCLEPGKGSWALETALDGVMDGATVEHIIEAARVLSRYAHALAVRSFPKGADWAVEREDLTLRHFAQYATVPVINLESSRRHPCQGLADAMTLGERLGDPAGKRFVLHWAWHPKPLPTAVPASAAIAAAHLGMDVVIARPEGYDLDPDDYAAIRRVSAACGGSLAITDDLDGAIAGAHAVYAKSWGALSHFGRPDDERVLRADKRDWILTADRMATTAARRGIAMHCLPVRRNVEIAAAVLDGPSSAVIDQAENRLHVQRALLLDLMGAGVAA